MNVIPNDEHGRYSDINILTNVVPYSCRYPNVQFVDYYGNTHNVIDERIMSLQYQQWNKYKLGQIQYYNIVKEPVFLLTYNTDNYYHFVYDTLSYMEAYFRFCELSNFKNLKILLPKPTLNRHYPFVYEFLELLGINISNVIIAEEMTRYDMIFYSNSLTHGIDSNLPPHPAIKNIYSAIIKSAKEKSAIGDFPKKIYVSRRSWMHGDTSNIGTNYTTRRKLVNEDKLVDYLSTLGYTEVFTELLRAEDTVKLFNNATHVIGPIGGGMANALFCKNNCSVTPIVSPTFMDINNRFKYCFSHVDIDYFEDTYHIEQTEIKTFMRVSHGDKIGEISSINGNEALVSFAKVPVAGWNHESEDYNIEIVPLRELKPIDKGLNSPWEIDMEKFKNYAESSGL